MSESNHIERAIEDENRILSRAGGPAFPRQAVGSDLAGIVDCGAEGMTLRDWFAGQVLAGMMADEGLAIGEKQFSIDAARAYAMADAMIMARSNSST